jgi:hypothetical protein
MFMNISFRILITYRISTPQPVIYLNTPNLPTLPDGCFLSLFQLIIPNKSPLSRNQLLISRRPHGLPATRLNARGKRNLVSDDPYPPWFLGHRLEVVVEQEVGEDHFEFLGDEEAAGAVCSSQLFVFLFSLSLSFLENGE